MNRNTIIGIIIAIALIPFIDGLIAKRIIMQRIASISRYTEQHSLSLTVSSYSIGWLSSTIYIKLSSDAFWCPSTETYPITISHGPIVFVEGKPKLALANVKIAIPLKDELSQLMQSYSPFLVKYNMLIGFDSDVLNNYYQIADVSLDRGAIAFGGMNGMTSVTYRQGEIIKMSTQAAIGATSLVSIPEVIDLPQLKTSNIYINMDQDLDANGVWVGDSKINTESFSMTTPEQYIEAQNGITTNKSARINGNYYDVEHSFVVGRLLLNPGVMTVTEFSNLNISAKFNNLNADAMANLNALGNAEQLLQLNSKNIGQTALTMLSPTTTMQILASANTNAGSFDIKANVNLQSAPKNQADIHADINADVKMSVSPQLFEMALIYSIKEKQQQMLAIAKANRKFLPTNNYEQSINALATEGKITPDLVTYLISMKSKVNSKDELVQQLTMSKEFFPITDEIITVAVSGYEKDLDANKQNQMPVQLQLQDPATIAKNVITNLINNGYITQDKDSYVINFSKKGDAILINGKDAKVLMNDPALPFNQTSQ